MNNPRYLAAMLSTAIFIGAASSWAFPSMPEPQEEGNITYITGGFGDEEKEALNTVRKDYNLSIVNAKKTGAYVGDTNVIISDRNGEQILDTQAGPLFYAQLPPGRYVIEGDSAGQTHRRNVTIAENAPTHLQFTWK